jgi:hypothetical protein
VLGIAQVWALDRHFNEIAKPNTVWAHQKKKNVERLRKMSFSSNYKKTGSGGGV